MPADTVNARRYSWAALVVVLIGFALRIHQLGRDSFWNDEAGQALAAIQPTLTGMLTIIRSHAMAMPLDYFVTRLISMLATAEFVMRFPQALFGTLALATFCLLARRLINWQVALFATLLYALSAPHIRYAQELRFYSALCLFYTASTLILFKALKDGRARTWALYVLVTGIGAYFHPYVLLSILNGFGTLPFLGLPRARLISLGIALVACGALLALLFFPGYEYFGAHQVFHYDLLEWNDSIPEAIARGLGWRAFPYTEATPVVGAWELLNTLCAGLGLLALGLQRKHYPLAVGFTLGTLGQIAAIILADWLKGYWFTARQLLHLAPLSMLLAALGAASLADALRRLPSAALVQRLQPVVLPALAGLFCLTALPRLDEYYTYQRSTGREVVAQLLSQHQPGEPILIIPNYEEKIYRYYILQAHADALLTDLKPTTWQDLPTLRATTPGPLYLTTPALLTPEQQTTLTTLGFTNLSTDTHPWYGPHALYLAPTR